MASFKTYKTEAALLECREENDVTLQREPFVNNKLRLSQESQYDDGKYDSVTIDLEDIDDLIEILEYFQTQHKER